MNKFQALGLPEPICTTLEKNGITEPTAVQNEAIPVVLSARDLISSARTGSGKTLAYALPVITRLLADERKAALVLVPTREIGVQVQQVMQVYLRALGVPPATLIIGGVSFGPQIQALKRRPPVIIATPGRLNDHLSQGKLRLDHVSMLVLDEADRMLDMGFLPQVKQILRHVTKDRQTLLFSATMPSDLARACNDMLRDPARVAVDAPNAANVDIEQRMREVDTNGKQDALLETLGTVQESALVFTRTKRRTDRVAKFLEEYGVKAERIHGDRSQAQRQKAIDLFRGGKVKVLVATDIAARGLDIPLVELVINFDLPEAKEDYVHRIGRTGRAGAQGVAISFVSPEERGHWASISGQRREGSRPSSSSRPFGRGGRAEGARIDASERPMRREKPARSFERRERPEPREEAPRSFEPKAKTEQQGSWSKPAKREWSERPQRRSESFSRDREPAFASAGRNPRPQNSRFQRWGQPRQQSGDDRGGLPRNPKHIFTGREGDEQRTRGPRRDFQDRRPQGEQRPGDRKPRFGGHGHSAPPAQGRARGRWANRQNRDQPSN